MSIESNKASGAYAQRVREKRNIKLDPGISKEDALAKRAQARQELAPKASEKKERLEEKELSEEQKEKMIQALEKKILDAKKQKELRKRQDELRPVANLDEGPYVLQELEAIKRLEAQKTKTEGIEKRREAAMELAKKIWTTLKNRDFGNNY